MSGVPIGVAILLHRHKDELWELRVKPPFSEYQAFGMAVASIDKT